MPHIGIWSVVQDGSEATYNSEVRRLRIDPGSGDSLDVRVWKTSDDVEDDRQWGSWSHWILEDTRADELVEDVMKPLGNHNAGASSVSASYRTDEPRGSDPRAGSATTQPRGGWTKELVLADKARKRDELKVDDRGPQ